MATRAQSLQVTERQLEDEYQAGYVAGHAHAMGTRERRGLLRLASWFAGFGLGILVGALYWP
jgi:hypothetical protein